MSAASVADERDKYTLRLYSCLGVVIAGASRKPGGGERSILAHVMSDAGTRLELFRRNFLKQIRMLAADTEPASWDAGYAGGCTTDDIHHVYEEEIALVQGIIGEELRIPVRKLWEPKTVHRDGWSTDLYYKTQERTLLVRQA